MMRLQGISIRGSWHTRQAHRHTHTRLANAASTHRQVLVEEPLSWLGQGGRYRGDRAAGSTGGKQDANNTHVLIELGEQEDWTDAQVVSNSESLEYAQIEHSIMVLSV